MPQPAAQALAQAAGFIADLKTSAAGRTLKSFVSAYPALVDVLGGIAETAPYLWDLVQRDPARLARLLGSNPDTALVALLAETKSASSGMRAQADVQRVLRSMKAEAAF